MGRYRVEDDEDTDDEYDGAIIPRNYENERPMSQEESSPDTAAYMQAYQRDGTPILIPVHQFLPQKRRTQWWLYMIFLAVLFQIVLYYGPPTPPQSDQTWYEFGKTKGTEIMLVVIELVSVVPYVTKWCWQGMEDDFWETWRQRSCVMQPISLNDNSWKDSVFGQSWAQDRISEALQHWKGNKSKQALILIMSGTVGVGKRHMATQISQKVICDEAKLEIDGSNNLSLLEYLTQIRKHAHRYRAGIILITHPEDMEFGLLYSILEELSKTTHLITMITTHVGSKIIHRHLFHGSGLDSVSLDLDMRKEFDSELGSGVSKYITSVAPFIPLGPVEMRQILTNKAESLTSTYYNSLIMTPELAEAWTSPLYIEYLQGKKDGKSIMTFSMQGANVLETNQLSKLQSQLSACLTSSPHAHDIIKVGFNQGKAVIQTSQGDDQTSDKIQFIEVCSFDLS